MGESGCPGRTLENQKKMCLQQITGLSVILLIFTTALGGSLVPPFYRWEDQGSERWGRWSDSHDQWLVAVGSDSRPTDFQSWAGRALFFSKHYSINRSLLIGNLHYTSSQWIVYRLHTRVLPWSFLGLSMLLQVDSSVVFVVDVQSLVHLQMNHFSCYWMFRLFQYWGLQIAAPVKPVCSGLNSQCGCPSQCCTQTWTDSPRRETGARPWVAALPLQH